MANTGFRKLFGAQRVCEKSSNVIDLTDEDCLLDTTSVNHKRQCTLLRDAGVVGGRCRSNQQAEELASRLNYRDQPAIDESLKARVVYLTPDADSWLVVKKRWRRSNKDEFSAQWALHPATYHQIKLYGKVCSETRFSQSWGFSYKYSGGLNSARPLRENLFAEELCRECSELLPLSGPYNGCLQNWYEPQHSISSHSDDEKSMRRRSNIQSFMGRCKTLFVEVQAWEGRRITLRALVGRWRSCSDGWYLPSYP